MSHKMGVENGQGVQYKSFPLSHLLSFEIDGLSKAEKDKDFLLLAKKREVFYLGRSILPTILETKEKSK